MGGAAQGPLYAFKNVDYYAFSYETVKNQHCQSTLLGGREGVTKKGTLYTSIRFR